MSPLEAAALVAAGTAIGVYATAIGASGAFLIAPLLLFRYPGLDPQFVTTASLTVAAISSGLSTVVVTRERRVDGPVALALIGIAVPAALIGASGTALVPRGAFDAAFAAVLLGLAAYLAWRPVNGEVAPLAGGWRRHLTDRAGHVFDYRIPVWRSVAPIVAATVGSTMVGITGGPIKVPIMSRIMRMPHAVVVPTAHVLNAATATGAVALLLVLGHGGAPMGDVPWLAAGVLAGNPLGQRYRRMLGEGRLTRMLALGLVIVALGTGAKAL